MNIRTKLR